MRRALAAVSVVAGLAAAAPAGAAERPPLIEGQYVVTFKRGTKDVAELARELIGEHEGHAREDVRADRQGLHCAVHSGRQGLHGARL